MHYHLKNIETTVLLGVYETEKKAPQRILINLWFEADSSAAAVSDNLVDAADYSAIEAFFKGFGAGLHFELLERLHAELLAALLTEFPTLKNVRLSIEKFPFEKGSIVVS